MMQELLNILDELSEIKKVKDCTMTLRLESGVSITLKFDKEERSKIWIEKEYDPDFDFERDEEWKEEDHDAED